MATRVVSGPSSSTRFDDEVQIDFPAGTMDYGCRFGKGADGDSVVIVAWEPLPSSGRLGAIQRHGGISVGDALWKMSDTVVLNMPYQDVMRTLQDRNILRRSLTFVSPATYERRRATARGGAGGGGQARPRTHGSVAHATETSVVGTAAGSNGTEGAQLVTDIRRVRLTTPRVDVGKSTPYAEYEIVCIYTKQSRLDEAATIRWTVWKRYSAFLKLDRGLREQFGWQMDAIPFPPAYTLRINKLELDFLEQRLDELQAYWQGVGEIRGIFQFDSPHLGSTALCAFLDFEEYVPFAMNPRPRRTSASVTSSTANNGNDDDDDNNNNNNNNSNNNEENGYTGAASAAAADAAANTQETGLALETESSRDAGSRPTSRRVRRVGSRKRMSARRGLSSRSSRRAGAGGGGNFFDEEAVEEGPAAVPQIHSQGRNNPGETAQQQQQQQQQEQQQQPAAETAHKPPPEPKPNNPEVAAAPAKKLSPAQLFASSKAAAVAAPPPPPPKPAGRAAPMAIPKSVPGDERSNLMSATRARGGET